MYYTTWHGWWWIVWLVPTLLVLWVVLGWSGRRLAGYGRYGARDRYLYGDNDDGWVPRYRSNAARKYRNRAPKNYRRSESRIQEDVSERVLLDEEIDPSAVELRVTDGVVSLNGTVGSRYEKRLAEQIADSVAGVVDVENRLMIGKVEPQPEIRESSR